MSTEPIQADRLVYDPMPIRFFQSRDRVLSNPAVDVSAWPCIAVQVRVLLPQPLCFLDVRLYNGVPPQATYELAQHREFIVPPDAARYTLTLTDLLPSTTYRLSVIGYSAWPRDLIHLQKEREKQRAYIHELIHNLTITTPAVQY